MRFLRLRLLPALLAAFSVARADVKMEPIFGDHMVLQQDAKLPVWGWADPNESVTVTIGKSTAKTTTGADGKWRVDLPPVPTNSKPQILTVQGKNTLTFQDVLVGEVWVCSGQSNMEAGVTYDARGTEEAEKANYPDIRIFWLVKAANLTPQEHLPSAPAERPLYGKWQVCTPDVVKQDGSWGGFSAVGFYFAHAIHEATKRPVGIIGCYWGGTPAQAWTSLSALQQNPALVHYADGLKALRPEQLAIFPVNWADYDVAARQWNADGGDDYMKKVLIPWREADKKARETGQPSPPAPPPPAKPMPHNPGNVAIATTLFNAMVNPLIPYAIKGVIWYQGEANASNGPEYATLFPTMITDWRTRWGQGDFPFIFVQLASFESKQNWPLLRESQLKTLSLPNTGMAVIIDIGDPGNIHPRDKTDVAARLALAARHVAYGENIVYSGPLYDSMKVEGNKIRVSFKDIGGGLAISAPPWTPHGKPGPAPAQLTGFEIAGADKNWMPADASIDGATIVVSSAQVAAPVAVRYDFANAPVGDLYNKEGLPASPFRTDDWN